MPMSLSTRRTNNRHNEGSRGLTMQFAWKLTAAGVATCLLSAWLLVLLVGSPVLAMDRDNIFKAFDALAALGFRPMVPVTREQIADPAVRK